MMLSLTRALSSVVEQLAYTKMRPLDPYSPHVDSRGQPAPKSVFREDLPGPTCPHLPLNFPGRFGGGSEEPEYATRPDAGIPRADIR